MKFYKMNTEACTDFCLNFVNPQCKLRTNILLR